MRAATCLGLVLTGLACRQAPAPSAVPPATIQPEALTPHTTSGEVARRNLDAQIIGLEQKAHRLPADEGFQVGLIGQLLTRSQYFGRFSDLDRALALAEALVQQHPTPAAYLTRARARSALHLFPQAMADISAAGAGKGPPPEAALLTVSIDDALGDLPGAQALLGPVEKQRRDSVTVGEEAILRGEAGDAAGASALFAEAHRLFRDSSPFPMAFLELQEGLMWERQGDLPRARTCFATAHRRVPGYVAAISHLAVVDGDLPQSIALLQPVVAGEDPEPAAQLSQLLRFGQDADPARAEALKQQAEHAYEQLLSRHPEAFADHAARFWLGAGADPAKALLWARKNAGWRSTAVAWQLVLEAAMAAQSQTDTCAAIAVIHQRGWSSPALQQVLQRVKEKCPQSEAPPAK